MVVHKFYKHTDMLSLRRVMCTFHFCWDCLLLLLGASAATILQQSIEAAVPLAQISTCRLTPLYTAHCSHMYVFGGKKTNFTAFSASCTFGWAGQLSTTIATFLCSSWNCLSSFSNQAENRSLIIHQWSRQRTGSSIPHVQILLRARAPFFPYE